jgi:hypothetical protein
MTTGLNTAAIVLITSAAPTLTLVGASQSLSYQITAEVTDVAGNVQSDVDLYYSISAGHDVATVSDSGLVTAQAQGQVVVQVSAAALGNTINIFTPAGVPVNAIYAEQSVQVVEGVPLLSSFSFTLSEYSVTITPTGASAAITITQTVANGDPGPVTYAFYPNHGSAQNWADPDPGAQSSASVFPAVRFQFFNNNVSGTTTSTFAVGVVSGKGPATAGTYTGYVVGMAQNYNANAPAGSQLTAAFGYQSIAGNNQPAVYKKAFSVTVSAS